MPSILLPWVETLGLRHQGVLMSAMRGCDTAPKNDPSKIAQRVLRGACLLPHAGRYANPKTYINIVEDIGEWENRMLPFLESWDHYPNHYVWHFIHAMEVIGYHGPEDRPVYARRWHWAYFYACEKQHVTAETKIEMDERLNADEKKFAEAQR